MVRKKELEPPRRKAPDPKSDPGAVAVGKHDLRAA